MYRHYPLPCSLIEMNEMNNTRFFLDECGQTGDLAKRGALATFAHQPIFSLTAVSFREELLLTNEVERIKKALWVQAPELESSIRGNRPALIQDILRLVCDMGLPFFREEASRIRWGRCSLKDRDIWMFTRLRTSRFFRRRSPLRQERHITSDKERENSKPCSALKPHDGTEPAVGRKVAETDCQL